MECCLGHDLAVSVSLPDGDPCVQLFAETPGRVLVSLPAANLDVFARLCAQHGLPLTRLGEVNRTGYLEIQEHFAVPVAELRERWAAPIPAAMQH